MVLIASGTHVPFVGDHGDWRILVPPFPDSREMLILCVDFFHLLNHHHILSAWNQEAQYR